MKDYIPSVKHLNIKNATIDMRKIKHRTAEKFQKLDRNFCPKESKLQPMSRKFFRNFVPERTIDLHGLTQHEAFEQLSHFFINCQSKNVKRVLVVTGGNTLKRTVIRSSFQDWVAASFGNYVISCSLANIWHGGQGAFYLLLKKI
ncbi:MAG: Smr/MutS family protein [Holosporaceae bacterium]|jgi:DNA-nicking Smr family endonuclease|nr:Smr/MutS family protein [Holosporaceae bacterium]